MAGGSDAGSGGARFVLDASVALTWCFPEERNTAAQKVLSALTENAAVVPTLWFLETSNALLVGERRRRLTGAESAEALRLLARLPLEVDDRTGFPFASDVLALARRCSLSVYDAAYLELAARTALPLATSDRRLRQAAKVLRVALYDA
jgi:predicted nucleic acid-binding protein